MENFIKKNLKILTSESNNQIQTIKRMKNQYWREIKAENIPKNPDISLNTIKYLIRTKVIQSQNDLDSLLNISAYLKKFLYEKNFEPLISEVFIEDDPKISQKFLQKKDFKKIKKEEYKKKKLVILRADNSSQDEIFWEDKKEILRKYGFDILINNFEPLLRKIIINEVIIINFGLKNWQQRIPKGVFNALKDDEREINFNTIDIDDFFEEVYFWCLKEIAITSDHYKYLKNLVGDLHKTKFIELMDELNELRKKIAHAKSSFTGIDLNNIIYNIISLCKGELGKPLVEYIENESFRVADDIPKSFFDEYQCPHNLPHEDYDLVGGFVGRKPEIKRIKQFLYSDQDRIISVTGAGGIGKTAVVIKTSYIILSDNNNPFECILWFSAKETILTADKGIVPIDSKIPSYQDFLKDILEIVDSKTAEIFLQNEIDFEKYQNRIYEIFSSQKCLLIIDNLETIRGQNIIEFIKNIPRPSQVLITSRRGLGEIERRYELPDFNINSAINLFRLIAKTRNKIDLLKLGNNEIKRLILKVKCYPLLIKWSLGKVFLGKNIQKAFSAIYTGTSEIAQFVFNDVFSDLKDEAKSCLYSMVIYGDKPISKPILRHLANLEEDIFEEVLRDLILTSFIYPESIETSSVITTNFCMLSLTRGFIRHELGKNKKELNAIQSRYYDLEIQIQEYEKSKTALSQSLITLGIKTDDEKIAFNYIKSGQRSFRSGNYEKAEENFKKATKTAPNFVYALIEYAKFKFEIDQIHESNELYIKAIEVDSEDWNTYYNFGISLKRQNRISQAIKNLEIAKKLNPDYIKIYNNLGRVYTFNGEYEKANALFNEIDNKEKYPNFKRKLLTYQFQADNLYRWSQTFFQRCDFDGALDKLKEAEEIIKIAKKKLEIDLKLLKLEKKVANEIGIILCKMKNFDEGLTYFKKAIKKILLRSGMTISNDEEIPKAYYNMAKFGYESKKISLDKINELIKKGISFCFKKKYLRNFTKLKMLVNKLPTLPDSERFFGHIKYYNSLKRFGVIFSAGETYLFLVSHFYEYIDEKRLLELEGKEVSFTLTNNPKKEGERMATLIKLESIQ